MVAHPSLNVFDPDDIEAALARLGSPEELRCALGLHEPSWPESEGRLSAVLVPLFSWPHLRTCLIKRTEGLRTHPGQMAFPGGHRQDGESPLETAIREAEEEVGLSAGPDVAWGALPVVEVAITGTKVVPVVCYLREIDGLRPNAEVASIHLPELVSLARSFSLRKIRLVDGRELESPSFYLDGAVVWGATARILVDLLERLQG